MAMEERKLQIIAHKIFNEFYYNKTLIKNKDIYNHYMIL